MYNVSTGFKNLIIQPARKVEIKAIINGIEYSDDKIFNVKVQDTLTSSNDLKIGEVISSRLNIQIKTSNDIPPNAKVEPFVRLIDIVNPPILVTGSESEWVPLGSFYIDNRVYNRDTWKLVCMDKLILTNQIFVSGLTYPNTMQAVFNEIVAQLGLTVGSNVVIDPSYTIDFKDEEVTIRDMLSYIAIANGASVRLTKDEDIDFVIFKESDLPSSYELIDKDEYQKFTQTNPVKQYTKVILTINSKGETITSGSGGAENTMELFNPHMSQSMLDNLVTQLSGFEYVPMKMVWRSRIYIEPGDFVRITDSDGVEQLTTILSTTISLKGGLKETSNSPATSPLTSEFSFKGSLLKNIPTSGLEEDVPYFGVTIGRENGLQIEKSDGSSSITLNSDVLVWKVKNELGTLVDRLYLDPVSGELVFNGNFGTDSITALKAEIDVLVTNIFVTETLYANKGVIADLTVDQLDTSDKVSNYLVSDTSDVDYIRVFNENIEFITSVTDGLSTEQAVGRDGPVYWVDDDPDNGVTYDTTDYPVTQYVYEENVKMKISFDVVNTFKTPVIDLGFGDGVTEKSGKARIVKDNSGLKLIFWKNSTGEEMEFSISNDGFIQKGGNTSKGIRNIEISETAPTEPQNGDLWIDTSV